MTTSPARRELPDALHAPDDLSPVHPGEILLEDFLRPLEMSVYEAAKRMGVPNTRLHEIIRERRSVTADTAIRLGVVFGTTPEYWLSMQMTYDLRMTKVETHSLRPVEQASTA
jgi:addiction module HigA family antidote